jgi:hypothetical protein
MDKHIGIACASVNELIPTLSRHWGIAKPGNGYKFAQRTLEGAVVSTGREDMGVHLDLPGACLAIIAANDSSLANVVRWIVQQTANFSRADFAVDATDSGLDIWRLRAMFEDGRADTRIRMFKMIESNAGGLTLYLGSPTSDRRIRIYNKAAERARLGELPDSADWIRIEYQARNEPANMAVHMLAGSEVIPDMIRSIILSAVDFPAHSTWTKIMRGAVTQTGPSTIHKGNRRKWLLSACATSFAEETLLDPEFLHQWEQAVKSAELLAKQRLSDQLDD